MRLHSRRAGLAAALLSAMLALTLAGCAPPVRERASAPAAPPAEFPEGYYLEAAARGRPVFRVDSPESLVVIEVRRAGSLARLGHDHVVASHEVGGYVAPDEGRADLNEVSGRLSFDQTDFGITPYSVLGGAIAVRNGVDLRFRVRARRLPGPR